jgi:hypothetical protein
MPSYRSLGRDGPVSVTGDNTHHSNAAASGRAACIADRAAGHLGVMEKRSYPVVDNLIRRAQRVAAGRTDPVRSLAQTISMACPGGADPYAVLGALVEGTVQTLIEHIPSERHAEVASAVEQLLAERFLASGVRDGPR